MAKVQTGNGGHTTDLISYNTMHHGNNPFLSTTSSSNAPNSTTTPKTNDLNVRLRAAMAIAKTLGEFHDGGVSHGKISPGNIVLDTFEGDYVATLIDLSEAVIFKDCPEVSSADDDASGDYERMKKKEDLKALGGVLKQLFRGFDTESSSGSGGTNSCQLTSYAANTYGANDYGNSSTALALSGGGDAPYETWGDETRRKRNKAPTQAGEGLPIYLGSLISTLLLTGSGAANSNSPASTVHYESAQDVYLDLKVMLDNSNPFYRQTELDERMIGSRLKMPDMFYGRQVQMSMLMHLFQSVVMLGNQPSIATISG